MGIKAVLGLKTASIPTKISSILWGIKAVGISAVGIKAVLGLKTASIPTKISSITSGDKGGGEKGGGDNGSGDIRLSPSGFEPATLRLIAVSANLLRHGSYS